MSQKKVYQERTDGGNFQRFQSALKQVLSVSKEESDRALADEKAKRKKQRGAD